MSHHDAEPRLRLWVLGGALLGGLLALLLNAPARWAAAPLAQATRGHLQLDGADGSLWSGSAGLVLTGGTGSRDASRLPGRAHWQLGWADGAPQLRVQLDCCTQQPLALRWQPGLQGWRLSLPTQAEPLLRLPAEWLAGLGTPWNTLQLGGQLRLSAQQFALQQQDGRLQASGQLQLELHQLSSRLATVAPLGSYRLQLMSTPDGANRLELQTLDGALLLQGQGSLQAGRARFAGEARAAAGREAALNNLLNIIGRRDGERSVITIG